MLKQYQTIKNRHQDAILFFHLGDFYEMFFSDAEKASKVLQIALTARDGGELGKVPMCGIPYASAESYIAKLIHAGHKVALCDQMEDPSTAKGLVERSVVRVVTPGTLVESGLLQAKQPNHLAALTRIKAGLGLAVADVSTGAFWAMAFKPGEETRLEDELARVRPSELILPQTLAEDPNFLSRGRAEAKSLKDLPDYSFAWDSSGPALQEQFGEKFLAGVSGAGENPALYAAGAILLYLKETQRRGLEHMVRLRVLPPGRSMGLDGATLRNLEIASNLRDGSSEGSLFAACDACLTAGGSRFLREALLHPLMDASEINARQAAVEEFRQNFDRLAGVRKVLDGLSDLARITGRLGSGLASPRDLASLRETLARIPALKEVLKGSVGRLIGKLLEALDDFPELRSDLERNLSDEPPFSLKDGGVIRDGASPDLDELRKLAGGGRTFVAEYQDAERQRTGISSLKVKYNHIFGYFIEITNQNLDKVPSDYIRRGTLANAERFVTSELKEKEDLILGAEDRASRLELRLFEELRDRAASAAGRLQTTAEAVSELDCWASAAHLSEQRGWVRPVVDEGDSLEILSGRHPVLDATLGNEFVPNDLRLGTAPHPSPLPQGEGMGASPPPRGEGEGEGGIRLQILTGPNMAGKSTYMRQNALIILLAQAGLPVPAKSAKLGVVDRIFTRVGASDNLAAGQSTFMVEMNETASILHNATSKSFILLDEVGRGTSTFDGISIAWAVAEDIAKRVKAKTLFATHYFELTRLSAEAEGVANASMAVREWNDKIVFLRKVEDGATDRSYGIHVARLAGLPRPVLERAKAVLSDLEASAGRVHPGASPEALEGLPAAEGSQRATGGQPSLFEDPRSELEAELRDLTPETMTPIQALAKLDDLARRAREGR